MAEKSQTRTRVETHGHWSPLAELVECVHLSRHSFKRFRVSPASSICSYVTDGNSSIPKKKHHLHIFEFNEPANCEEFAVIMTRAERVEFSRT